MAADHHNRCVTPTAYDVLDRHLGDSMAYNMSYPTVYQTLPHVSVLECVVLEHDEHYFYWLNI